MKVATLSDIAGQVTSKSDNADRITIASVCLPFGALKSIRKKIPSLFPKWRNASDEKIAHIVDIVLKEALTASASSIDKRAAKWKKFWQDADDAHRKTASLAGGSISFIEAANLVRYLLFIESTSLVIAHAIKIGAIPRTLGRKGILLVQDKMICDNDIQGDDNVEAFADFLGSNNLHQPLTNSIGIEIQTTSLRITTEQNEPLLLLADYVAGIFQAANSTARILEYSNVSISAAKRAHERLLAAKRFHDFSIPFTVNYTHIFPEFSKYLRKDTT